ncbi:MAG: bifunctional sulfate adenylyltransferase/adenylylsulfate kinase [Vicinamibacteria bacterium]|nr:bifunctional sulfate adenylyltransferase/adenylylsulfate kinase [Vicinamibacteria bacterium]
MTARLVAPHGGTLVDLMASEKRVAELRSAAREMPSHSLTPRQQSDLELLMNGGFSPLRGFMGRADRERVCREMRLTDGTFWPLPVALDVPEAASLAPGASLALRDAEGVLLAVLSVSEAWRPDLEREAEQIHGSYAKHPEIVRLLKRTQPWSVAGAIEGIEPPRHYDFVELRATPAELRRRFAALGWRRIAALHLEREMHRAEQELALHAGRDLEASLLLHFAVGLSKAEDVGHYARIRCLQHAEKTFPRHTAVLALVALASRAAGARERLLQAIVRQNHGCSHFILTDAPIEAGVAAEDAAVVDRARGELGIEIARMRPMIYVSDTDGFMPEDEIPKGAATHVLTEADLAERLSWGKPLPGWFTSPEIARELSRNFPPRARQGFTVFFTGLPSSGKSTLANVLLVKLLEIGGRPVTLLDGDVVRKHLSSELGFSREHRDLNIRRIGFVASEITKNGGIALCAPIAPYDAMRKEVRSMIEAGGGFLLVHVATPVPVCEQRDRKGLYAKARAGIIKEFTGVSDPYEPPADAGLVIDTSERSPEECVQEIVLHLEKEGYIGAAAPVEEHA